MSKLTLSARKIDDAGKQRTQCAVLPIFGDGKLAGVAKDLDKANGGSISQLLSLGDFAGKAGQSHLLPGTGAAARLLLIGCGKQADMDSGAGRAFGEHVAKALAGLKAKDAVLFLDDMKDSDALCELLPYAARLVTTARYRYNETLSKPKPAAQLGKLVVSIGNGLSTRDANRLLSQGQQTGDGVNVARELANLPGNICTPNYLAKEARKLGRKHGKLTTKILDEKKMRELGMGSLLSVSAGSDEPARFIIMEYKGGKAKAQPYVLVGKGITFDTGGISLKPGAKMDEMKFDMGGAASVFGTMSALCELELPINVVGIVAAAENMPSGRATKPGDVVTSMSGRTIEILNTDAEGRLVLCDALTYAERYKPAAVIDIATLTGACVVALGHHASGLYANKDSLADELLAAGTQSHDRAWRMPLWDDYQKQLNTNFADVANIGGPGGGSITAACFLARFAEKYDWAHLDIAGSAWTSAPKGATGRPVAMLTRYLQDRAGQ
ncbi:MAG: leucyl aminopeptidase [Halieaceae bacterium]|nr:leucyl aminopeptidase [Halieaceae bacterium]